MARRRNRNIGPLTTIAMESDWPVAAALSVLCLLFGAGIAPALLKQNPIFAMVTPIVMTVGVGLGMLFGAIALFRYSVQAKRGQGSLDSQTNVKARRAPTRIEPTEDNHVTATRPPDSIPTASSLERPDAWSLDLLQALEWKRFEDLCCAYYDAKGIRARATPLGPDGGIDIHLFQDDQSPEAATTVVQCKAWATQRVGIKPLRELLGVMTAERITKGFFMTVGGYTDEAKAFARKNGIVALDGKLILAMLERLPADARKRLLELATAGDYTTPTCVSCGVKMVRRDSRRGAFWGCRHFPRCRQKLTIRGGHRHAIPVS